MSANTSSIAIREATLSDVETVIRFQIALAKETESLVLDHHVVAKGVNAVFTDRQKGVYWVAENHKNVIASLLTIPEWSDWRNGTVLWIHSVYVLPEYRKMGIFRKLYCHLKERVEQQDSLKGLRLFVDRRNENAEKVYQALGMSAEHYKLYEWLKSPS